MFFLLMGGRTCHQKTSKRLFCRGFSSFSSRKNQSDKALAALYKVGNEVNGEEDLDTLFNTVMDSIMEVTEADRAFLILRHEKTQELEPKVIRIHSRLSNDESSVTIAISRTIVNNCLDKKVAILSSDAMSDERFQTKDTILLHGIRSVVCVPLLSKQESLGVIYVDSQMVSNYFSEYDLELLIAIGNQAGTAIGRAQLHRDLHNLFIVRLKRL
jgi:adenylate cyclase